MLKRAFPQQYTDAQIDWELPIVKANALLHAARLMDGEPMIWPDAQLSPRGRWWSQIESELDQRMENRR